MGYVELKMENIEAMFADPSGPVGKIMERTALKVEAMMKALLLIPGSGRTYGSGVMTFVHGGKVYSNFSSGGRAAGHVASAPGEPPASDTGALLASIGHVMVIQDGKVAAHIGSSKKYALYLEKGTAWHDEKGGVHIAPRPFMVPALRLTVGGGAP